MVDLHLHTKLSFDSNEEPENYLKRAKEIGENCLGFSEHYDYDAFWDGERDVTLTDLESYNLNIDKLKRDYPDIQILQGIEFGYREQALSKYREIINQNNFDYVINSLHTLPDRGDCYHDKFFEGRPLKESYYDYFKGVLESVNADYDYQIIGHLAYVCRYRKGVGSKIKYSDFAEIIDEILKAVIARDKCLEINTSIGVSECTFLPDVDVIKRYIELGGKLLSFGSDAHKAENYLKNSKALKEFLTGIGVNELYYYKNRQPVPYKI
ncbi:MAG: histidinol-phosphatase HisJ family protein [Candidatus Coproplasma sp.]